MCQDYEAGIKKIEPILLALSDAHSAVAREVFTSPDICKDVKASVAREIAQVGVVLADLLIRANRVGLIREETANAHSAKLTEDTGELLTSDEVVEIMKTRALMDATADDLESILSEILGLEELDLPEGDEADLAEYLKDNMHPRN